MFLSKFKSANWSLSAKSRCERPQWFRVEDEFEEGKVCEQAYAEIMNAYQRLCQRLGVKGEKDEDIERLLVH